MSTCENCTQKGNLAGCEATPCSKHETWYAIQLRNRIAELEAKEPK